MTEQTAQKSYLVAPIRGGCAVWRSIAIVATGLVVKASPGQIYSIYAVNLNAAARYLKIYNKATAPTQSDTPVMTIYLPASGAQVNVPIPIYGMEFNAGISARVTTGLADNDTGAPTAAETLVVVGYE